jgi:hypothetical protein
MSQTILKSEEFLSTKKVSTAESFLQRKSNSLSNFSNVEDLVTDEEVFTEKELAAVIHNFSTVRKAVADHLWAQEVFVGMSVIDEFILNAIKSGQSNISVDTITSLANTNVTLPGFLLVPMHGFGLSSEDMGPLLRQTPGALILKDFGLSLCPQTNSFENSIRCINAMMRQLGISASVNSEDMRHHYRAGSLKWLVKNPLMLIKITSHTGAYFENQFIYTLKAKLGTAGLAMLHAVTETSSVHDNFFASTAKVNNWETLDIKHYLVGEVSNQTDRPVEVLRVPMNVGPMELARLSDLHITVHSKKIRTGASRRRSVEIFQAMKSVEDGYLRHVVLGKGSDNHRRVYSKLLKSLEWYKKSFASTSSRNDATVSLAIAFETLLTDAYAKGIARRIERRAKICLKGVHGKEKFVRSILNTYYLRSDITHSGSSEQDLDLVRAQAGFARCFCYVSSRLQNVNKRMNEPLREIIGDA